MLRKTQGLYVEILLLLADLDLDLDLLLPVDQWKEDAVIRFNLNGSKIYVNYYSRKCSYASRNTRVCRGLRPVCVYIDRKESASNTDSET